jgi:hypothetical protein
MEPSGPHRACYGTPLPLPFMYFYRYIYIFLLLCILCSVYSVSLCRSVYCLCVNVYCTAATTMGTGSFPGVMAAGA